MWEDFLFVSPAKAGGLFSNHWIPVFTSVVILSDSEESASEQQILHFVQDDRLCGVFFCWDSPMPDKLEPNGEN